MIKVIHYTVDVLRLKDNVAYDLSETGRIFFIQPGWKTKIQTNVGMDTRKFHLKVIKLVR